MLNFLHGNIKLSLCNKRKLQKRKAALRKVAENHLSLSGRKRIIVQLGVFLLLVLGAILLMTPSLNFRYHART